MEAERISHAVGRIEAALGRIERVRPAAGSDPELVARHEALRESVSATIAELDTLIGRLER